MDTKLISPVGHVWSPVNQCLLIVNFHTWFQEVKSLEWRQINVHLFAKANNKETTRPNIAGTLWGEYSHDDSMC